MPKSAISLFDMPLEVMLIVEHPSGVLYGNQVGGVVCCQAELEGVLAPVDLRPDYVERMRHLDYPAGSGLDPAIADAIDAMLSSEPGARYLRVDRSRLHASMEAWVYVLVESPETTEHVLTGPYFGAPRGFGVTRGVLTWPNSD